MQLFLRGMLCENIRNVTESEHFLKGCYNTGQQKNLILFIFNS